MSLRKYVWPVIGLAAVVFSIWLLYRELRGLSLNDMIASFRAIPLHHWLLSGASTLLAYAALAGYDRIALLHLRRKVPWLFITVASFTTYALSHNVGASVLSGAVVRYRAYTSRGLTGQEVGVLVAFCSFTFMLGTILLGGIVLVFEPTIVERFVDVLPLDASRTTGFVLLGLVALYVIGSMLGFRTLSFGKLELSYPRPRVVLQQLVIGPLELLAAAGIIYFALPEAGNPGYFVVLGIFLVSFSAALVSHAPGGLGVLELVFITGLPDMNQADVLAALVVFRLFYLLIPFVIALVVILLFERSQFSVEEQ
ncbi:lysylphosphatidylglycerol synthase domain-containing protein [Rhizobium sp. LjRoot30]|uniref:lysylphosphatidylglycerol synthase domain-containing protein n=1 Tax=Rhizobium sp. LjRoot30 TaxID=3342320 RepID=UPI003ECFE07B